MRRNINENEAQKIIAIKTPEEKERVKKITKIFNIIIVRVSSSRHFI